MRVPVVSISPVAPEKNDASVDGCCSQSKGTQVLCRHATHSDCADWQGDVSCHDQKRANREKEEELTPTWVLCCFLLSAAAAAAVLITRRPPNPSIPRLVSVSEIRHAMPCPSFPSHPVMDPVFCLPPLSHARCPPTPMPKMPPAALFIVTKGKRHDAAVDEGSDAAHAPPCSRTRKKKRSQMVEFYHAMRCDAVRTMWIPTNMPP
jgi:hypothetical protein